MNKVTLGYVAKGYLTLHRLIGICRDMQILRIGLGLRVPQPSALNPTVRRVIWGLGFKLTWGHLIYLQAQGTS